MFRERSRRFGALELLRGEVPYDFVISYNQEQVERVAWLSATLRAEGLSGWTDQNYVYDESAPMERQISSAFNRARFILLHVPEGFRDSPWCRAEYSHGLRFEAESGVRRVLLACEGDGRLVP